MYLYLEGASFSYSAVKTYLALNRLILFYLFFSHINLNELLSPLGKSNLFYESKINSV